MSQATITDDEPEAEPDGLYAVVTNYADDPHPHVEDVFEDREDAEELLDQCATVVGEPTPIAWTLYRLAPGEVKLLDP